MAEVPLNVSNTIPEKGGKTMYKLLGAASLLLPNIALSKMNMTEGVTPTSQMMFDIHSTILLIVSIACVVVFSVMFYGTFKFRKSKGAKAATFHENTTVEVIWTAIPAIVLIIMAVPATKALLEIEDTSNPDMTIQATGFQWKWKYDYIDEGISFFSNLDSEHNKARQLNSGIDPASMDNYLLEVDQPLVVPINKKIRILTTANDVLHAWWVPELGIKRDAIPGFINESWMRVEKEGIYRGQCAELCGKDHGFMPIVVIAKNEKDYQQWVAEQKQAKIDQMASAKETWTKDKLMAKGEQAYNTSCSGCHQPTGTGLPGVFPSLVGTPLIKGPVAEHITIVLNGKSGTAMQAFGAQLDDATLAAIITYERNAWGNDTGDVVQPSDVKALR